MKKDGANASMINLYAFEQRIERHVAAGEIVGLAVALVHGEEITYARGFGRTSVEDGGAPVTPLTLFCIGSISKTVTSTLVMRLVDAGLLDLDRPVVSYLPGFAFSDPELGGRITLRHVLSHSTGLPSAGKDFGPRDPDALRRFVWEEIPRYGFVAAPGEIYLYSNTVPVLAAHVAEAVTGMYYEQLAREWVFQPLGMERATFDRTVAMTYPVALAHDRSDDGTIRTRHRFTDNVSGNPAGFGLASTIDLARFATMHLNGGRFGGEQYLSPAEVAEMHRAQIKTYVPGSDEGYGLGLYSGEFGGHRQVSHGGMLESYWCNLSVFPNAGVGLALQCNCGDGEVLGRLLHDLTEALLASSGNQPSVFSAESIQPEPARMPLHAGTYLSLRAGLATVTREGDRLALSWAHGSHTLEPSETGQYLAERMPVAFVANGDEPTEYLVIDAEPFRRLAIDDEFVPQPDTWTPYEGIYEQIPDDPYPTTIRVADGVLYRDEEGNSVACTPLSDTRFVSEWGVIDFQRSGADGEIVLVAGEASHLRRRS